MNKERGRKLYLAPVTTILNSQEEAQKYPFLLMNENETSSSVWLCLDYFIFILLQGPFYIKYTQFAYRPLFALPISTHRLLKMCGGRGIRLEREGVKR